MERLWNEYHQNRKQELLKRDADVAEIYNHKKATKQKEVDNYTNNLIFTRQCCEDRA